MKFKKGDRVRRTAEALQKPAIRHDTKSYIVSSVDPQNWLALEGNTEYPLCNHNHPFWGGYFELVQDEYLTPTDVLQCVHDNVVLEVLLNNEWRPLDSDGLLASALFSNEYRKKPVSQTVSINDIEVPKPIDKNLIDASSTVYCILMLAFVGACNVSQALGRGIPVWSTREDAEAALKAIRSALGVD